MDANLIYTVEYKQWTTTNRANLKTKVLTIDGFVGSLLVGLEKQQVYDFIAKMQSSFAAKIKDTLQPGEYLVAADYSENNSAGLHSVISLE